MKKKIKKKKKDGKKNKRSPILWSKSHFCPKNKNKNKKVKIIQRKKNQSHHKK